MGSAASLNELRASFAGDVLGPEDAGYDSARRCFNALADRRPAVIARCLGAGDVAAAFDFARAHRAPGRRTRRRPQSGRAIASSTAGS